MRKFWDWYALIYDSLRHLLPYQELLGQTVKALNIKEDNMRILDAGCGTGNVALALKKVSLPHIRWEGIDFSEAMVARAKAKLRLTPWASVKKGNLNEPLPYSHASFDRIVCLNALYAVSDPRAILKEFSRVLTFGGILVLANPRKNPSIKDVISSHCTSIQGITGRRKYALLMKTFAILPSLSLVALLNRIVIKRMATRGAYHFFDMEEIVTLLENSGFRILQKKFLYGNTAVFLVATKCLYFRDKLDEKISCEIAHAQKDLDSIHRLRYLTYCEEMRSLNLKDYPEQKEWDKYDPYSIHIIARLNKEIIGILRLIKNTPTGFLMEEKFRLPSWINKSKTVEHSRGIIRKEYRDKGIYSLMLQAAYEWQKDHGYTICIGAPRVDKLSSILLKIGWEVMGKETKYHEVIVVPMFYQIKDISR